MADKELTDFQKKRLAKFAQRCRANANLSNNTQAFKITDYSITTPDGNTVTSNNDVTLTDQYKRAKHTNP